MSLRKILEELANCYYECGKLGIRIPAKLDLAHQQILALIPKKKETAGFAHKNMEWAKRVGRNQAIDETKERFQ